MLLIRVHRLSDSFRFRLVEWVFAAFLFAWGAMLLRSFPTFSLDGMVGLARLAPEPVWGTGCLFVGATRLSILFINGLWRRSAHGRAVCAFFSCFAWLSISFGLWTSGVVAPGQAIYPIILVADIYIVFRAARDAREADEAVRNGRA